MVPISGHSPSVRIIAAPGHDAQQDIEDRRKTVLLLDGFLDVVAKRARDATKIDCLSHGISFVKELRCRTPASGSRGGCYQVYGNRSEGWIITGQSSPFE
jgi:hypothetical protein